MFAILVAVVIITVLVRTVAVIRTNRPTSPPRSHSHEIDSFAHRSRAA